MFNQPMSIARSQVIIAFIFILSLVLQVAVVFYDELRGYLYADERTDIILKLLAVYAVHLAVIVGGIFSQRIEGATRAPQTASWLAISLSLVWNLLLIGHVFSFVFSGTDQNQDLKAQLTSISSVSSFLLTGALAYFFTRRE
jgi:hypothetical protein